MTVRTGLLTLASTLLITVGLPGAITSAAPAPPTFESANRGSSPLRVSTAGGVDLYLYGTAGLLSGATATFAPYDNAQSASTVANVPVTAFDSDTAKVTAPSMPAGPVKITLFNPGSTASVSFMTVSYGDNVVELPVDCTETSISLNANIGDYVRLIPAGVCNDTYPVNTWTEGSWSVGAMANLTTAPPVGFGYLPTQHPLSRVGSFTNPTYWPTTQPGLAQSEYGSWHPVVGSDWDEGNSSWTGGYNRFNNEPTGIMLQVNAETTVGDNVAFIYEKVGLSSPAVQIPIVYAGGRIDPPAPNPAPAPEPEPSAEPTVTPTVTPVVIPTTAPVAEPVALPAGEGGALINGVATPVTVAAAPGGKAVVVSAGGVTVEVGGTSPDGTPLPLAADGSLVIAPTGGVQMGGSGFSPNSMVSLYLYSTPTKLGELPVSANGSYSGAALIPAGIETGSHTIQAIGYTPDGSTLALSVGVTVKSVAAIRGANPVVKASAGAKIAGTRFTVNATGVQARCMVSFWTKGSTVKAKAGAAGRASATLTAPSTKGTWALTAKVTGAGCEQRVAKTMIKVTAEPAGNTHAAKAGAKARK